MVIGIAKDQRTSSFWSPQKSLPSTQEAASKQRRGSVSTGSDTGPRHPLNTRSTPGPPCPPSLYSKQGAASLSTTMLGDTSRAWTSERLGSRVLCHLEIPRNGPLVERVHFLWGTVGPIRVDCLGLHLRTPEGMLHPPRKLAGYVGDVVFQCCMCPYAGVLGCLQSNRWNATFPETADFARYRVVREPDKLKVVCWKLLEFELVKKNHHI